MNRVRSIFASGDATLGTHLFLMSPAVVEIVGLAGAFDYVEFQAEDAVFDLLGLEGFCRAAELHNLGTMIKIGWENNRFVAQRSVAAGFEAVLFAGVKSPGEAKECLDCLRPVCPNDSGSFGGITFRRTLVEHAGGIGRYLESVKDTFVSLMIEKRSAVEHLDEVLTVAPVDMVQWGPFDYSLSAGIRSIDGNDDLRNVERQVIRTCLEHGIPPRAEIKTAEEVKYYADLGVRHFNVSYDLIELHNVLKSTGDRIRQVMVDAT